ncbi:MAG: VOC family protein [Burkholderiales bacterium]|nr:VOC family protein [Burkholderiales bacterium]
MPNAVQAGAVIFAKDLHHVARFYEKLLGLPAVHSESDHIVLASAQCELVIHAIPKAIADSINISVPPERRTETPIKLYFFVASIPEARARAPGLGGDLNPPQGEWEARGFRACDAHDPEGNVLQLRELAP